SGIQQCRDPNADDILILHFPIVNPKSVPFLRVHSSMRLPVSVLPPCVKDARNHGRSRSEPLQPPETKHTQHMRPCFHWISCPPWGGILQRYWHLRASWLPTEDCPSYCYTASSGSPRKICSEA